MPHLVEMTNKYPKDKVVVIGLSDEPASKVEPYVQKNAIPYAIGYGSTSDKTYGVNGIPHAIVVGPDGTVKFDGYPSGKGFDSIVESLAATVKSGGGNGSAGGGVNAGVPALGDAVQLAIGSEGLPKDVQIGYQRTDPVKKTTRELKVSSSLEVEFKAEGSGELRKGKIEEKEFRDLLKAVVDTEFAVREFKEPPKTNVTISVSAGKERREIRFDAGKGFGNFGRVNKLLEELYSRCVKKP